MILTILTVERWPQLTSSTSSTSCSRSRCYYYFSRFHNDDDDVDDVPYIACSLIFLPTDFFFVVFPTDGGGDVAFFRRSYTSTVPYPTVEGSPPVPVPVPAEYQYPLLDWLLLDLMGDVVFVVVAQHLLPSPPLHTIFPSSKESTET